jgi:hypothetical protein
MTLSDSDLEKDFNKKSSPQLNKGHMKSSFHPKNKHYSARGNPSKSKGKLDTLKIMKLI